MMKRGALLVVSAFLLGACALPVPVQLASWALDGISLITTHKSVADHGLSLIANEDCAMWRAIEGDSICSGNDAGSTVVAVAAAESPEELASFETAAGSPEDNKDINPVFVSPALPPLDKPTLPEYSREQDPSEFADAWAYIQSSSPPPEMPTAAKPDNVSKTGPHPIATSLPAAGSVTHHPAAVDGTKVTAWFPIEMPPLKVASNSREPAVVKAKPLKKAPNTAVSTVYGTNDKARPPVKLVIKSPDTNTIKVKPGFYFIIGSFSKRDRAFSLAAKHSLLKPKVAISQMDGGEVNRVIVGPFTSGDKDAVHHRLRKDGIFDAWAARINPARWSLLDPSESSDLAQLTQ